MLVQPQCISALWLTTIAAGTPGVCHSCVHCSRHLLVSTAACKAPSQAASDSGSHAQNRPSLPERQTSEGPQRQASAASGSAYQWAGAGNPERKSQPKASQRAVWASALVERSMWCALQSLESPTASAVMAWTAGHDDFNNDGAYGRERQSTEPGAALQQATSRQGGTGRCWCI